MTTARIRWFLAPLALGALLLGTTGCIWFLAGAAAGAGAVVWVSGKLKKKYDVPVGRASAAASGAVKGLGFRVESDVHDASCARIKAQRADGKPVWVDVDRVTDTTSEVTVRVGAMGDKEAAMQVMDAIDARLGVK